jgi:hypothetical protein
MDSSEITKVLSINNLVRLILTEFNSAPGGLFIRIFDKKQKQRFLSIPHDFFRAKYLFLN